MKVYCENCSFVRSSSDCFGGVGISCRFSVQNPISQEDTPVRIVRQYRTLAEMNKDNNCRYYRKKRWWQIIWANTNG